jgi:hypothetical protein
MDDAIITDNAKVVNTLNSLCRNGQSLFIIERRDGAKQKNTMINLKPRKLIPETDTDFYLISFL